MAGFNVQINGLTGVTERLKNHAKEVEAVLQKHMNEFATNMASDAKGLCPVDEGQLVQSIHPYYKPLDVGVTVSAPYASFVEFGTRGYAAAYVSTLPTEWQEFAAAYKGKGEGSFHDMVVRLTEWVLRKGISATKTRSGRNSQSKGSLEAQYRAAYNIAKMILIKGSKPHPFMLPAYIFNIDKLETKLKEEF